MGYTNATTVTRVQMNTATFPKDHSLGRLYVADDAVHERFYANAQGSVLLPTSQAVRLKVNPEACTDLSSLTHFAPEGLHTLCFEGAVLSPKQFGYVANLKGLKALQIAHCEIEPDALAALQRLPLLEEITIWWAPLADGIAVHLATLPSLQVLDLSRTSVSDASISAISAVRSLKNLALTDSLITDAGACEIAETMGLESLSLAGCQISDAALPPIAKMVWLKQLQVSRTKVSDAGLMRFSELRPDVKIVE